MKLRLLRARAARITSTLTIGATAALAQSAPAPRPSPTLGDQFRATVHAEPPHPLYTAAFQRLSQVEKGRLLLFVASLKGSPNEDRALRTLTRLLTMRAEESGRQPRLTLELTELLVLAVSQRATDAPEGVAGVLGLKQAEEAARALTRIPADTYRQIRKLLHLATPGFDGVAERSLILKGVGARATDLMFPGSSSRAAMKDLSRFAGAIRGMERRQLIRQTTPLDLDSTWNTSLLDPLDPTVPDTKGDNDGLVQVDEFSCASAVAQMAAWSRDPIYALKFHQSGGPSLNRDTWWARQQLQLFQEPIFYNESDFHPYPLTEAEALAFTRTGQLPLNVKQLRGSGALRTKPSVIEVLETVSHRLQSRGLDPDQAFDWVTMRLGLPLTNEERANAAEAARRLGDSAAVTPEELATLKPVLGLTLTGNLPDGALDRLAAPATHMGYTRQEWQGTPAQTEWLDHRLEDGWQFPAEVRPTLHDSVPHEVFLTDVRGPRGHRVYLISDPYTGRTFFVPSKAMFQDGFSLSPGSLLYRLNGLSGDPE